MKGFRLLPEFKFILARVTITILLRDILTIGVKTDIIRGLPVIHVNYIGYDEQAHRRGPDSLFAHWALRGIDRAIQSLWSTALHSEHRHYELWVYSDHGQEKTLPCKQYGHVSINDAVQQAFSHLANLSTPNRFPFLWHSRDFRYCESQCPEPIVLAMGPVGHIYLDKAIDHRQKKYSSLSIGLRTEGANCLVSKPRRAMARSNPTKSIRSATGCLVVVRTITPFT